MRAMFVGPLIAVAVFGAIVPSTSAQVTTAWQIVGTVQDSSEAPVPGALLRLDNQATRLAQEGTTAADGGFVFPTVAPGVYDLTVTMKGFETGVYRGIVVNAGRTTNQPVTLKVGGVTETVEVVGAAPVLQTTTTTVADTGDDDEYSSASPVPRAIHVLVAVLSQRRSSWKTEAILEGWPAAVLKLPRGGRLRAPWSRRAAMVQSPVLRWSSAADHSCRRDGVSSGKGDETNAC